MKYFTGLVVVSAVLMFSYAKSGTSQAAAPVKVGCKLTSNEENVEKFLNEKCDLSKTFSMTNHSGGIFVCCPQK